MTDHVLHNGKWTPIRELPIQVILPCGKCVHLQETAHKEYHKCTYQPPKVPRAYWQYDVPYKEPAQWQNTKYLEGNGPFTTDAKRIECGVFEAKS